MSQVELSNQAKWVEVHVLAAEHGDCIVVSYGVGGKTFRLVVDAGVAKTADRLKRVLKQGDDAVWELLVVTHVDLDHIGGTLGLLEDASIASRFQDIWFNGRQHLDPPGTESLGFKDGIALQTRLSEAGFPWNRAFQDDCGAVRVSVNGEPAKRTLSGSGANLTILSPTVRELARLRTLWDKFTRASQKLPSPVDVEVISPHLESMGGSGLDIAALAATTTRPDRSAANASSIAFIFEFAGRRILFAADAHADVLCRSSAWLPANDRAVDLFKLPHHGSAYNVTKDLITAFPSTKFVISTNGGHDHPDDVALARLVRASPTAELLFNYAVGAFHRWSEEAQRPGATFTVPAVQTEDGIVIKLL